MPCTKLAGTAHTTCAYPGAGLVHNRWESPNVYTRLLSPRMSTFLLRRLSVRGLQGRVAGGGQVLAAHSPPGAACLVVQLSATPQPGSSVHGTLQAGTLERVAISSSRESSRPGDRTPRLLRLLHRR